jgi:hypothetical protein
LRFCSAEQDGHVTTNFKSKDFEAVAIAHFEGDVTEFFCRKKKETTIFQPNLQLRISCDFIKVLPLPPSAVGLYQFEDMMLMARLFLHSLLIKIKYLKK